jgi:uncharacterized membrane protein
MLSFVGGHFLLSWPPLRERVIARIGQGAFTAAYSLLMVVLLIWVVAAYRVAPPWVLWDFGPGINLVPVLAMPFALMLVVAGLTSRNPTAVMGEGLLTRGLPVTGILTISRHPFLSGAAIWSVAHLIANGDAASAMLFGGMACLSVGGMFAIDHKRLLKLGRSWADFAARTSRIPLGAAFSGRVQIDWAGIGWVRPAIAMVLYAALFAWHDRLFGVPVVIF